MNRIAQSNYESLQAAQAKLTLAELINKKITALFVGLQDGHIDLNGVDPKESPTDSYATLLKIRRVMRQTMGLAYQDDFIQDLRELVKPENIKLFVQGLITEGFISENSDDINFLINELESKNIEDVLTFTREQARNSLFGTLAKFQETDSDTLYDEIGFHFGRPNILDERGFLTSEKVNRLVNTLKQHLGGATARGYGLITGATVGQAALLNILTASKSVDVSMFQLEHSLILSALYYKKQQFSMLNRMSTEHRTINVLLAAAHNPNGGEGYDPYFNWINQAGKALLGDSVSFHEVMGSYAHEKFIATDLPSWVIQLKYGSYVVGNSIKKSTVMIGSFNMTRGALGNIVDNHGALSNARPYNFELGFNIGYELVRYGGMKFSTFAKIIGEARGYVDRVIQNKFPNINNHPEHILSGPETYTRLQKALGLGSSSLGNKVDAFFMLNVITDRGMLDVDGKGEKGRGLFHTIHDKLSASKDSTITIFVTEGFRDIRSSDISNGEGVEQSKAMQALRQLEHEFEGRFKIVEVRQHVHAKSFMVFHDGINNNKGGFELIAGSANVSAESLGGSTTELGLYLGSQHFEDDSFLRQQAENILSNLWMHSHRAGKGINPLKNLNMSSADRIMLELKKRLNPSLSRLITVSENRQGVGSLISLSISIKDPSTGKIFEVKDAVKLSIQQYNSDPNRLFIPELQKVIDPVIGQDKNSTVKYGTGTERGHLRVVEYTAGEVVAAALEEISIELEKSTLNLLSRYGDRLLLTTSGQSFFKRQLRRMGSEIGLEILRHQEGLPIGSRTNEQARQLQRLIFGIEYKDRNLIDALQLDPSMALDTDSAFSLHQLARMFGGDETNVIPLLSLREENRPILSPMSIERSFEKFAALQEEMLGLNKKHVAGNAPSEVIRVKDGKLVVEPLLFTLLAESLSWDKPAKILLADAFNYLTATNYDDSTQAVMSLMNPAKLAQWAQRLQNMLGSDVGYMHVNPGSPAEKNFRRVEMPFGPPRPDGKPRMSTEFRFLLLWGLNEQTYVQADAFRGANVGYRTQMSFQVYTREALSGADEVASSMFDGRVKLGPDGNWMVFDNRTNSYIEADPNKPLLEVTHQERHIHGPVVIVNGKREVLTMANPIYGQRGARVIIHGIVQETDAGGRQVFKADAEVLQPVSSSMRMLSQTMKMVFTGLGSFVDETGKRRSFFTDLVESINKTFFSENYFKKQNREAADYFGKAFRGLGLASDTNQQIMDAQKLHGVVGESIIKSGVALLHTGYTLLEGYYDGGAWSDSFLEMFETRKGRERFSTMLESIKQSLDKKGSVKTSDVRKRYMLDSIEQLLGSDNSLETGIKEALANDNQALKKVVESIRKGELKNISDPFAKMVIAAAAAYHIYNGIHHSEMLNDAMRETTKRMAGTWGGVDSRVIFGAAIPIVMRDDISVAQFPMSNRQSAIFHTNYVGNHSQIMLKAISTNRETIRRREVVSELFAIGYLGGTSIVASNYAKKSLQHGGKSVDIGLLQKENIQLAGVHFEPFAYTFTGMSSESEGALSRISEVVRRLTYEDLSDKDLQAVQEEFKKSLSIIKKDYTTHSGNTNTRTSPQREENRIQSFKLQHKARLGGAVIYVPVLSFDREHNSFTHEIADLSYEKISLPSPDAAVKLQNFDDYVGDILNLSHEIQRENIAIRNIIKMAEIFGGHVSSAARDQYEQFLLKVETLKAKIREASTTDIQKTISALSGVQGFAQIANTFGSFDGLVFSEDKQGRKISVDNVIVMGDEVMAAVTKESLTALRIVKKFVSQVALGKQLNVSADDPTGNSPVLKLKGKKVIVRRGKEIRYTFESLNFGEDSYLSTATDTYDGNHSDVRGVSAVLKQIGVAYDLQQSERTGFLKLIQEKKKLQKLRVENNKEKNRRNNTLVDKIQDQEQLIEKLSSKHFYESGLRGVFSLKVQQHALKMQLNKIENQTGVNAIELQEARLKHGLVSERLEVLAFTKDNLTTLHSKIRQVKENLNNKSISVADKKEYKKMLAFLKGQQHRINAGLVYTSTELMSQVSYEDIDHAFMAAGIDLDHEVTHAIDNKSMNKTLSTNALVELLQLGHAARQAGLAVAGLRAGGPVGNFGPVGYFAMNVRDFNAHMRRIDSNFNLDPYMNRRAMFLHISGMALNLGDFDGDNIVISQIKRYTFLKSLDSLTHGGIGAVDSYLADGVEGLRKKNVSEKTIEALFREISGNRLGGYENLSLLEEMHKLEQEIYRRNGNLLVEQTERYLGLHKGELRNKIQTEEAFKDLWHDAQGNSTAEELLLFKYASQLNMFANDMFGHAEQKATGAINAYLKKSNNSVYVSAEEIDRSAFEKFLQSEEGQAFHNDLKGWYKGQSTAMVNKYLENILGTEVDVNTVLKYGVQVAFASTKLIGNWTNIQTMQQSMNSYSRYESYNHMQRMKTAVIAAAESRGDSAESIEQFKNNVEKLQNESLAHNDEIHQRLSGYMLNLQQATRDAIKEKSALALRDTSQESVFESMVKDNVLIKAIDKSYTLIYGRSIFDVDNSYDSEMSRESDLAKVLTTLNVDEAIKIGFTEGGQMQAEITSALSSHEHYMAVVEHMILPHLEAMAKMQKDFLSKEVPNQLAVMSNAEKLKFLMSDESGISASGRTTALLMAHSMWRDYENYSAMKTYTKSLMMKDASNFENARNSLDDHLKLVVFYEATKGGKLNEAGIDRLLGDIVSSYVSSDYGLDRLVSDARSIDSTGYFADSMTTLLASYMGGQNIDSRLQALQRNNQVQYQILAEMEYELADAVRANPSVQVSSQVETKEALEHLKKAAAPADPNKPSADPSKGPLATASQADGTQTPEEVKDAALQDPSVNRLEKQMSEVKDIAQHRAFKQELDVSREIKAYRQGFGSALGHIAHQGLMALIPSLSKSMGIFGAGASVFGMSQVAQAQQLVHGTREGEDSNTTTVFNKMKDYLMTTALMWEPLMSLRALPAMVNSQEQALASAAGVIIPLVVGTAAASKTLQATNVVGFGPRAPLGALARASSISSLIGMMAAGHTVNKFIENAIRLRHHNRESELLMHHQIAEDVNLAKAIEADFSELPELVSNKLEDPSIRMVEWDGTVIDTDDTLKATDFSEGLYLNDGTSVAGDIVTAYGDNTPESMNMPQDMNESSADRIAREQGNVTSYLERFSSWFKR